MSWLQRVFLMMSSSTLQPEVATGNYGMNLTAALPTTDWLPAKKPEPVIPLEFVGINGEYDPQGLAKRVAQALDQHPEAQQIRTLCILQTGSRISLLGKVANTTLLQQIVAIVQQVNGTKEVDVQQVVVEG